MDWTTIIMVALFFGGSALALLGQRLGWPLLVAFANWVKGIADKDGDGKPDVATAAKSKVPATSPAESQDAATDAARLEVAPPTHAAFAAAGAARPRKVAMPWLLMILTMVSPVLQQLIAAALDALAKRLGKEPDNDQAVAAAWQVYDEWVAAEKRRHPAVTERAWITEPAAGD